MDKELSIIVAVSDNMAIGRGNKMPWHISEDMKFFKKITTGGSVIMGRKTWESLRYKPLPNRQNIVVSRTLCIIDESTSAGVDAVENELASEASVMVTRSLEEAIGAANSDNIFVIGGGEIYRQAIGYATRVYMTKVHTFISDADTFFPQLDQEQWMEAIWSETQRDEKSGLDFEFVLYKRISG